MSEVIFQDTFNRGDGPVGNGWEVLSGAWAISGQQLVCNTSGHIWNPAAVQSNDQSIQVSVSAASWTAGTKNFQVVLRNPWNSLTIARVTYAPNGLHNLAGYLNGGGNVSSALQSQYGVADGQAHTFLTRVLGRTLQSYVDGLLIGTLMLPWDQDGTTWSLYTVASYGLHFTEVVGRAGAYSGLFASPDVVAAGGSPYTIKLYGNNTNWTPGSPGEPTFFARNGAVYAQEVNSAEEATLTYYPTASPSADTIIDPLSGTGARVSVSDINDLPVRALYDWLLALVNGSGVGGGDLATIKGVLIPDSVESFSSTLYDAIDAIDKNQSLKDWLADLYGVLNTYWGDPVTAMTLWLWAVGLSWSNHDMATKLLAAIYHVDGAGAYTLQSIRDDIRGVGGQDIADVMDALNNLGASDHADILQMLRTLSSNGIYGISHVLAEFNALNGPNPSTLTDLKNFIYDLVGPTGNSLQDILDAIADLDPTATVDLSEVLTAIEGSRSGLTNSSFAVLTALAAARVSLEAGHTGLGLTLAGIGTELTAGIAAILAAIAGLGLGEGADLLTTLLNTAATVADLLTKVNELKTAVAALPKAVRVPPIWPGDDDAALGATVALGAGKAIAGPMDGAIVEVTEYPAKWQHTPCGGRTEVRYLGWYAFATDRGDVEEIRFLNWDRQVLTPSRMVSAGTLHIYTRPGVVGTVRPWLTIGEGEYPPH